MGRYTLTMETYDNQKIKIQFTENGKKSTKVSLKSIDELTTQVSGPNDLVSKLNMSDNIKRLKNVTITYVMNKQTKSIPVAYDDKKELQKITFNTNANIDFTNIVFKKYIYKFLRMLESKEFYEYVINSSLVIEKQKEYIEARIKQGDYSDFCTQKLMFYSATYRQFRNILFLIEAYNMRKENQVSDEIYTPKKINTLYEPDDEKIYTEEEKLQYQQYLDSLPDDIPDYIDDEEHAFTKKKF